ncbi:putative GNAT family acetyltransferase [Seiridium unicorne]|uniref:GNAT family acetyltransferase n=1 Tax=Seiridium unicorne TaxID=138068 RepID=A0ABR2UUW3_9PEZI
MPLQVQPASEADAQRAVEIEAIAYGPSPFNAILFPGPMPANAKEGRAEFLTKQLKDDSTTRWLKVVDTDIEGEEQMVAFAKWHIYTEKPELTPREFGQGCNAEACELLFGGLQKQRIEILGDRPYVYLHMLQTDPQHKRRGAGTMLTKKVLDEAERLGMIAYLESSEAGHSLYAGLGFKDVELQELDMSQWGATATHKTWSMICEPRALQ